MEQFDYLVVGGGVAGTTAAETIRGRDPAAAIAIVSDEPHPLYSRVLLPNYVKGLASRDQVFLRRPEDYRAAHIAFFGGETAEGLDAAGQALRLSSGRELGFGKLLIAAGGRPRPLGIPGEELPGVSRFQTIEDADRMRERLTDARRAVVVGGSFIALEYLDILAGLRIPTTLVIPQAYLFSRFLEPAAGELLRENFRRHGIALATRDRLCAVEGDGAVRGARLETGGRLECDFVGVGIGLERNTAWLGSALTLTPSGIATDEFLQTSCPGIFAAGDVADFQDITLGVRHTHGNWGNAFRQGELAGRNMAHPASPEPYRSVTSYGIRNLGFHVAFVGHVLEGPGIDTVSRFDAANQVYERFFLRQERMVGAVVINRPEDRAAITTLIRDAVPLSAARERFTDAAFDIATLIP